MEVDLSLLTMVKLPLGYYAMSGERRLAYGVLKDSLRQYGKKKASREQKRAKAWIRDDNEDWPLSFRNVCLMLDINPDWLRGRLLAGERVKLQISREIAASGISSSITAHT